MPKGKNKRYIWRKNRKVLLILTWPIWLPVLLGYVLYSMRHIIYMNYLERKKNGKRKEK